jgi:Protein of unknown function (DUF2950)
MILRRHMQQTTGKGKLWRMHRLVLGVMCAILPIKAAPQVAKAFDSPQQAAEALVAAAEKFDVPVLKDILGPAGYSLVDTGEPPRDRENAAEFVAKAHAKMSVAVDPENASRATIVVGDTDWPMPIPLVKKGGKWSFDSKDGAEEILYRRIGEDENAAIDVARGYVEAQNEYALQRHGGVNQYAQRIISTPGTHDGLAWKNPDGAWDGPVGEAVANAIERGYTDRSEPFHGYYFKVLKRQGPSAPLGEMDFVVKGVMIGGFALAAAPSEYRVTGVKTFIVSNDGVVYEKDMGKDTLNLFKQMDSFNPDKSWSPVPDDETQEETPQQ